METSEKRMFEQTALWLRLEDLLKDKSTMLDNIKNACIEAADLLKTVRDTFPNYTLHDEVHSTNVLRIMGDILADDIDKLTELEVVLLVLSAFYHDMGMVYTAESKQELLESDRFDQFIAEDHYSYTQVYKSGEKIVPDSVAYKFFRVIHHERCWNWIEGIIDWDYDGFPLDEVLDEICKSHGESIEDIKKNDNLSDICSINDADIKLCCILLRLADVLDFDKSRAPAVLYDFSVFSKRKTYDDRISDIEWLKHQSAFGFRLRTVEYNDMRIISFSALCRDVKIEHEIRGYVAYAENEIKKCQALFESYKSRDESIRLPKAIDISGIKSKGYKYGEFALKLDKERVLKLLVGNDIYNEPEVFVRELVQNAIDTVRTREAFYKDPDYEKKIYITDWIDNEGYNWFRIDDTGLGMSEEKILKYFLNIGQSYYGSSEFEADKMRRGVNNYKPISRFGIGILSCFMCGDTVEVSTYSYETKEKIRMSISGIDEYYSFYKEGMRAKAPNMPGKEERDRYIYRRKPGTSIAVRTRLFNYGLENNFYGMLKEYIYYPDADIYYHEKKFTSLPELEEKIEGMDSRYEFSLTNDMLTYYEDDDLEGGDLPIIDQKDCKLIVKTFNINSILKEENILFFYMEVALYLSVKRTSKSKKYIIYSSSATVVEGKHEKIRFQSFHCDSSYDRQQSKADSKYIRDFEFWISFDSLINRLPEFVRDLMLEEQIDCHNGIRFNSRSRAYDFCICYLKDSFRPKLSIRRNDYGVLPTEVEFLFQCIRMLSRQMHIKISSQVCFNYEEYKKLINKYNLLDNLCAIEQHFRCNIWRAAIQMKYVVYVQNDRILLKDKTEEDRKMLKFPPLFFVEYDNENIFSISDYGFININHPFGKWLLSKHSILMQKYPAMLKEIIGFSERYYYQSSLISSINSFLEIAKSIDELEITNDIFVEEGQIKVINMEKSLNHALQDKLKMTQS